jgi:hypothetical protein
MIFVAAALVAGSELVESRRDGGALVAGTASLPWWSAGGGHGESSTGGGHCESSTVERWWRARRVFDGGSFGAGVTASPFGMDRLEAGVLGRFV